MRQYELALMLHPDLEIDLDAPLKRLDDTLKSVGAEVEKRDDWGKRKLAYRVKGQDFAIYLFYVLSMQPEKVSELESALRLNDEVLRHLIVSYDKAAAEDESSREEEEDSSKEQPEEDKKPAQKEKKS